MKTVSVHTAKHYDVHIGSGLLISLGRLLKPLTKAAKVAVISDSNVWPLYGEIVVAALTDSGFEVCSHVFPAGEESKNGQTYLSLLEFMAQEQLTRTDCVVALGGGVVGDITGFAAATYLRGIDYVQVPTTVLAAVDSSVGGKTAIDLQVGKNLAGAFYQPIAVVCDTDTLTTLPRRIFKDGCAEVIKYGVLYDPMLFAHLQERGLDFDLTETIARCVELKRDVVTADEFDHGKRQMLNLGHTVGHGIEAESNFGISHGQAVAAGMAIVARAAAKRGLCDPSAASVIENVLKKFDLPIDTAFTAEQLYKAALSDKKRNGSTVNLIVPNAIGSCSILATHIDDLKAFIEEGL